MSVPYFRVCDWPGVTLWHRADGNYYLQYDCGPIIEGPLRFDDWSAAKAFVNDLIGR